MHAATEWAGRAIAELHGHGGGIGPDAGATPTGRRVPALDPAGNQAMGGTPQRRPRLRRLGQADIHRLEALGPFLNVELNRLTLLE